MQTSLKSLLSAVLLAAGISAAYATDLPVKAPAYKAPILAVPPSWTGWYAGINAGYGFGSVGNTFNLNPPTGNPFDTINASNHLNGFIGGGQVGYNYQITPNSWVAGIEADLQYTNFKGSDSFSGVVPPLFRPGSRFVYNQDQRVDWLATVRGRLGWTPGDHTFLLYATGGLAVGGVKASDSLSLVGGGATITWAGDSSTTRAGWTIGGGIEARVAENWTAKLEYLYYDLGHLTVAANSVPATGIVGTTDFEFRGNIVRAGLNYRFTGR
ncbi:MAG TPA: outer membrane protein [Pseudolabrys sp.]|nr:outer membrane protein [Pseudolabrys sp.]